MERRDFTKKLSGSVAVSAMLGLFWPKLGIAALAAPKKKKQRLGALLITNFSGVGVRSNFVSRLNLDTKKTESLPIDLNLAHFITKGKPGSGLLYIFEQGGRKILEISERKLQKKRTFQMPDDYIVYGHGVYHGGLNAMLLTASSSTYSKDAIMALDLDSWSMTPVFHLETAGRAPHDIALLEERGLALVIAQGEAQNGRRSGGPITLVDLKMKRSIKTWNVPEEIGCPVHFSPWIDGDSIYFTLVDRRLKSDAQNVPGSLLKSDLDEYRKRTVANEEFHPSCFARLSISTDSIEYFKTPVLDYRVRGPFSIFWSPIPELRRYVIVDFIYAPGVWVWDMDKKEPVHHMIFDAKRSNVCLCADGRFIAAVTDAGDGYILEIPTLRVREKFKTNGRVAQHPFWVSSDMI